MNTDDLAEAIAISLDVERQAAGWTLEDLSKELGLSVQTLGRYLTRRTRDLPVSVLTRTCAVIGVPLADVISRAEQRMSNARAVGDEARAIVGQARTNVRGRRAEDVEKPATPSTLRSAKRDNRGSA